MREDKIEQLLNELGERTAEPVRPGLAEEIKQKIPKGLMTQPHRGGAGAINIIVDLRISKLAAAAIIIITTILLVNFFGRQDSTRKGIYEDGMLLVKYCLGGANATSSDVLSGMSKFYEYLVHQGMEPVYYGDKIGTKDKNAVLMHWRLPTGEYKVIFADLRTKTVSSDELVKLQARMLQNKAK